MSEAWQSPRAERERLEAPVRGELMGARTDAPDRRTRELRVGMIMAFAEAYARALAEAELAMREGERVRREPLP
jgi:hypothetical protein